MVISKWSICICMLFWTSCSKNFKLNTSRSEQVNPINLVRRVFSFVLYSQSFSRMKCTERFRDLHIVPCRERDTFMQEGVRVIAQCHLLNFSSCYYMLSIDGIFKIHTTTDVVFKNLLRFVRCFFSNFPTILTSQDSVLGWWKVPNIILRCTSTALIWMESVRNIIFRWPSTTSICIDVPTINFYINYETKRSSVNIYKSLI